MRNKLFFLVVLQLFIGVRALSQTITLDPNYDYSDLLKKEPAIFLDKSSMAVTYRLEVLHDTLRPKTVKKTNVMLLQISAKYDKYFDLHNAKMKEFLTSEENKKRNSSDVVTEAFQLGRGTLSDEIYWNYPEKGQLSVTIHMVGDYYLYKENIPKIEWKMIAGSDEVAGYNCRIAVCHLFGRNYTAWYAPDIPISKGPWKFSGLPGLILKVTDDRNQVSWTCIGLEERAGDEIFFTERDYIKTDKSKFLKSFNNYKRNPIPLLKAAGSLTGTSKAGKPRAYNPIELE